MQTNARCALVAFAALALVACAGPSSGPSKPGSMGSGGSTGTGGNGGSTGTGGDGSGGSGGSGGGGATGGGGSGGGGGGGTGGAGGGGGTTTSGVGCKSYVACLNAAMSDADAMACDMKASSNATTLLGAAEQCVGNYCLGMMGAAARCKLGTDMSFQNLDGTAAFDATTGAPTGDCGACLLNGDAGLWGEQCMPTTDAACNTSACAQQTAACNADG